MDNIKNIITGGIITLVVGGAAFSFSQQDVINNLSEDTGMTEEQAEQYVNNIAPEDLVSWSEVGNSFLAESKETRTAADGVDCENFDYDWQSTTLTCTQGKEQLLLIAATEEKVGNAYLQLDTENATKEDMQLVINYLDQLNTQYGLEVSRRAFDSAVIEDMKMTNSYNKSLLKAALESSE
ncbi:MAG: hypothetical protein MUF19_02605 [Candidatus Pacebacteria bacterium]|jgi:hypothetical protein|nr:hypothetical protein [Candidatus Paceibacterota bacterium]